MHHILLSSVACLAVPYSSHKGNIRKIEHKMCLAFFKALVWNISRFKNSASYYQNVHRPLCKVPVILFRF